MSEIRQKSVDILVVDDDEVLAQVVGRVLSQQGFSVRHAATVRRALEMAQAKAPELALLDLCLPDGNGVELATSLRQRQAGLPLLLMTAYPLREQEKPALADLGARLLNKPFSPTALREAVNEALAAPAQPKNNPAIIPSITTEGPSSRGPSASPASGTESIGRESMPPDVPVKESLMRVFLINFSKRASLVVLILIVLIGLAMVTGIVRAPWVRAAEEKAPPAKAAALPVKLVPNMPHTLEVPPEVRETLGMRKGGRDIIHVVQRPKHGKELVLPGSTLFDPTRLYRVRARFAPSPSSAKCTDIFMKDEDPTQTAFTAKREIRSGDHVKKDQPLAWFESVDVGSKKNDLVDAMVQLRLDQTWLDRAYKSASVGALSEIFLMNQERNRNADRNAVARAENTLRTWDIPEDEINKVREYAEKIGKQEGKRNPEEAKEKAKEWATVTLRAPEDGVIVERNLTKGETVVDNTTNLFQIAKLDRLAIVAYCPEDDLPTLHALPTSQRRWTVRTVGSAPIQGFISDISYLIDPNQHTAVVKGYIDNPGEAVRAGQFISATVELPPPDDVVEVPADAVMEDGQQAIVFVQPDPAKHYYTMRRVKPEARFDKTLWIRSKPFAKGEDRTAQEEELGILPKEPLRPGERILQTAVGELKVALMDKESQAKK